MGDTVAGTPVTYYGYVYEHPEIIINSLGQEELSGMQIYLKGDDASAIALSSKITCLSVTNSRIIAKKVYRGRAAAAVIGMVYLP